MNDNFCTETELSSLKFCKDGKLIIGASKLNGRYWTGSLWCFPNADCRTPIACIETICGISDILCFSDGNIIIGKDSGALDIYTIDTVPQPHNFKLAHSSLEHDDLISSLSINSDESKFSSSSYDQSIKIWDTGACESFATFKPIHAGIVWQSAFSTTDPNILLSCGSDGMLLLLDLRLPKPATVIENNRLDNKPTAVSWKPQSNNIFAVGKETGNIVIQDIRNIDNKTQFQRHSHPIFRLAFSESKPSLLASCADENKVAVTDIDSSLNTIYVDERHEDYVRGLAWDSDNNLISCGFDTQVLCHVIVSENGQDSTNEA